MTATRIFIRDIQRAVARRYKIPLRKMWERDAHRIVARPRQVAMTLAVELTPSSLFVIGQRFGGRDHSTVHHAKRQIGELIKTDPKLAGKIERLRSELTITHP